MLAHHFSHFLTQHHQPSHPDFQPLIYRLVELIDSGSSCLDLNEETDHTLEQWREILNCDAPDSTTCSPGGAAPLILTHDGKLYLQRYFLHEKHVFEKMDYVARKPQENLSKATIQRVEELFGSIEGNDQASAAISALQHKLTIISGGPGTGKTTTVVRILQLLQELEHFSTIQDCLLLAPTGKAADRLRQSIIDGLNHQKLPLTDFPTETSTIHRALGTQHGSTEFRHHANNPLQARVIVIDETSMVDLPLMARLLDACPDDARIILLGDENQLSSIQVGTVLSDLMDASNTSNHPIRDCSVTLRKSYRTKGPISGACDAIRNGDADKAWKTMTQSPQESMTEGAITQKGPPANLRVALEPFVLKHWLPVLRDESLDPLDRIKKIDHFRILTPTHLGLYGVESINNTVDKILSAHGILQRDIWYPGRSVIVQKNDYTMGIYNGDIGLTLTNTENDNDDLQVFFQAGEEHKAISPALLPECKTAWALTIHRTQGSEYDHILLIIPSSEESKILSRELLYTGLSRAKKSATIWCSEESLRQTIATTVHRASGLSDMFRPPSETNETYQSAL